MDTLVKVGLAVIALAGTLGAAWFARQAHVAVAQIADDADLRRAYEARLHTLDEQVERLEQRSLRDRERIISLEEDRIKDQQLLATLKRENQTLKLEKDKLGLEIARLRSQVSQLRMVLDEHGWRCIETFNPDCGLAELE